MSWGEKTNFREDIKNFLRKHYPREAMNLKFDKERATEALEKARTESENGKYLDPSCNELIPHLQAALDHVEKLDQVIGGQMDRIFELQQKVEMRPVPMGEVIYNSHIDPSNFINAIAEVRLMVMNSNDYWQAYQENQTYENMLRWLKHQAYENTVKKRYVIMQTRIETVQAAHTGARDAEVGRKRDEDKAVPYVYDPYVYDPAPYVLMGGIVRKDTNEL